MSFNGKTNWQFDEVVKEADLNRIEKGIVDAHAMVEQTKLEGQTYTDEKVAEITPNAIGAVKKSDFEAHTADIEIHVTSAKQAEWDGKETPAGAQAKANQAEGNAKNASLPRSGGTIVGQLGVNASGGAVQLIGGDHVYQEFYPKGASQGRKGYLGYSDSSSIDLSLVNQYDQGSVNIVSEKGLVVNGINVLGRLNDLNNSVLSWRSNPYYYDQGEEKATTWSPLETLNGINFSKTSSSLSFYGTLSSGSTSMASDTSIDITELSRLKVDLYKGWGGAGNTYDYGSVSFFISKVRAGEVIKNDSASNSGNVGIQRRILELDVAGLTGKYFIGISFTTSSGGGSRTHECNVYRVWGEF